MRKCIVALLFLSSVASAQKLPRFRRDPIDSQRAALREKLTRLAETRKSLGMPEEQPSSATELEALTVRTQQKRPAAAPQRQAKPKAAAAEHAWPPAPQVVAHGDQEPSLGDVARQYRAQKKKAQSKSN